MFTWTTTDRNAVLLGQTLANEARRRTDAVNLHIRLRREGRPISEAGEKAALYEQGSIHGLIEQYLETCEKVYGDLDLGPPKTEFLPGEDKYEWRMLLAVSKISILTKDKLEVV